MKHKSEINNHNNKLLLFDAIIASSDDAIVSKTLEGIITSWNPGAEKIFGYSADEMIGESILKLFPKDRYKEETRIVAAVRRGEKIDHFETVRRRKDGTLIDVSVTISPMYQEGNIIGISKIARDISTQKQAELISNQFQAIVDSSDDAIISKDLNGNVTSWNHSAQLIFGYHPEEMIGSPITRLFPDDRLYEESEIMQSLLSGKRVDHFETIRKHKDGHLIDVSVTISPIFLNGNIVGASKVVRDISKDVKARKDVWFQANYDTLTKLPNRERFLRVLNDRLNGSKASHKRIAIMSIDLDNFKMINDSYGHSIGDKVIVNAAEHIRAATHKTDFVARIGGDEFIVLINDYPNEETINTKANDILRRLGYLTVIEDNLVAVSGSIGIACYPEHGTTCDELIQKADHAMYVSKSLGRNQASYFFKSDGLTASESYELLCDLRTANFEKEIELVYQPIVDARTGHVTKAEALARWHHPTKGVISPAIFIPMAEKYGMILDMGECVMQKAIKTLSRWTKRYGDGFQLSINKSPLQFHNLKDDPMVMLSQLEAHGLSGRNIILEITEDSMMHFSQVTANKIMLYKQHGVSIALDDFGKGYSSLNYLKNFQVDFLKLDKAFVQNLSEDSVEYYLTEGVSKIAENLDIWLVAEGLETQEQHELLGHFNVDYFQGYYFSKPLTARDFELFMEAAQPTEANNRSVSNI